MGIKKGTITYGTTNIVEAYKAALAPYFTEVKEQPKEDKKAG